MRKEIETAADARDKWGAGTRKEMLSLGFSTISTMLTGRSCVDPEYQSFSI